MPLIIWTKNNELGISEIDGHHRILASLINDLGDSIGKESENEAIERALFTLISYSGFHFDAEEEIMAKYEYPLLKDHAREHEKFIAEVNLIRRKFTSKSSDYDLGLKDFLRKWFLKHTQGIDRKFAEFIEDRGMLADAGSGDDEQDTRSLKEGLVPFIVWLDKYNLGIDEIDEQHRALADSINLLHRSIGETSKSAAVREAISGLADYTRNHFRTEEKMLEAVKYPKLPHQKDEHARFTASIENVKQKYSRFETVVDFDIILFLKGWFLDHIRGADVEYVEYVKK